MNTKYIDVNGSWGIVMCYDLRRLDEYEIRQNMIAFGMRGQNIDEAVDALLYGTNTGFCVSRDDIRMSLIFIGRADGSEQWWDTVAHELLDHAKTAICLYYDVPFGSEDAAWLTGFLMRKTVQLLGEPCKEGWH